MRLSREMFVAIKTAPVPLYRLAQEAGFKRPEEFSRMLYGARPVRERHLPGLERIAQQLGVRRPVVKDSAARGARRAKTDAAANSARSSEHEGRVMAGASQGSCPTP